MELSWVSVEVGRIREELETGSCDQNTLYNFFNKKKQKIKSKV